MSKGDPIPTRFDQQEEETLQKLSNQTGFSKAEIVRRAVRLLRQRFLKDNSVAFIVQELSPPYGKKKK